MSEYYKIRVYALIIGSDLPEKEIKIRKVFVKPMSFQEQKKRKFSPLQYEKINDLEHHYKTFIALSNQSDPRKIKSSHVIYTDIDVPDVSTAINYAYHIFEDITQTLALLCTKEVPFGTNTHTIFETFDYQIVKLYKIDNNGKEQEFEKQKLFGQGAVIKIAFPTKIFNESELSIEKIENSLDFINFNPALKQSLEYITYAERCLQLRYPRELFVLNAYKAFETIFSTFSFNRKVKTFKDKLMDANKEVFNLTEAEIKNILDLKKQRDDMDVAHAPKNYHYHFGYLNKMPSSKNNAVAFGLEKTVAKVIKNYHHFLDSLIHIKIEKRFDKNHKYSSLIYVSNRGYYNYQTKEKNLKKLVPDLKKRISADLNIPYKKIKVYTYNKHKQDFLFKVSNDYKIKSRKTKVSSYVIL